MKLNESILAELKEAYEAGDWLKFQNQIEQVLENAKSQMSQDAFLDFCDGIINMCNDYMGALNESTKIKAKPSLKEGIGDYLDSYRVVLLKDSYDEETLLKVILLNNKHGVKDFQNAIYDAKEKYKEDIQKYGDDWQFISQGLEDFDYIEVDLDTDEDVAYY